MMKHSLIILTMLLALHTMQAQPGRSGFSILKLGIAGSGVSMGDAQSALARGASATFYNPAGVFNTESEYTTQFLLTHKEWIQDVRSQFLGVATRLDDVSALGFSLNTATVSGIEVRTRPGTAEGTFTSRDFSLGLSYARRISDVLSLGITAKYLFEKIYVDETSGFAIDLGAQYALPVENLTVGLAFSNLGSVKAMRTEKLTLPALMRLGPAYRMDLAELDSRLTLASDLLYIFPEKKAYLNAGVEFLFDEMIAARVGYQAGSATRGISTGVGLRHGIFGLDYGLVPLGSGLGTGHTFSLLLHL